MRVAAAARGNAEQSRLARSEARADMDRMAVRLQAALGFDEEEREDWARLLALLTAPAARGFWTAEARLLYDLQKVCVDHERGIYTFDLPRLDSLGLSRAGETTAAGTAKRAVFEASAQAPSAGCRRCASPSVFAPHGVSFASRGAAHGGEFAQPFPADDCRGARSRAATSAEPARAGGAREADRRTAGPHRRARISDDGRSARCIVAQ